MKIFFWASSMTDGTHWYRLHLVAEALKARGHDTKVSMQAGDTWLRDVDIIVGQRICHPRPSILWREFADPAMWTYRPRPKLVYELDDNLIAISPHENDLAAVGAYRRRAANVARMIGAHASSVADFRQPNGIPLVEAEHRASEGFQDFRDPRVQVAMKDNISRADLVTVTVPQLADALRPYNPNAAILPNSVPARLLDMPAQRALTAGRVVVGWQGSQTHTRDWAVAAPAVAQVIGAYEQAHMRFVGNLHPRGFQPNKVSFLEWTTDLWKHYERVRRFHIGLAPLEDTVFNRSKSPLRAVEMMALGVPGVYSDVPTYRAVVDHGVTGFLARSHDDWQTYLALLIEDDGRRTQMGDAARETARAWTIEERVTLWERAYEQLL